MSYNTDTTTGTDTTSGDSTRKDVILTEQNPIEILKELPKTVFPVECRFQISPENTRSSRDADFRTPEYPVSVRTSERVHIPETTVYFDNPAEIPPDGEVIWRPAEFIEQLEELLEADVAGQLTADNAILRRLTVVEVAPHLVTTDSDTGALAVKSSTYDDEHEMTIAQFRKHNSLSAAHVRNELADALPGESRTPARLTDVKVVTAKPARHGRKTTVSSGRSRYYTEAEAEKTGELERTPAHYQSEYLSDQSEQARPLSLVMQSPESFIPVLHDDETDIVDVVTFVGHEKQTSSFIATEVQK